eukprot:5081431-Pyramimonas_sp.AAC.1
MEGQHGIRGRVDGTNCRPQLAPAVPLQDSLPEPEPRGRDDHGGEGQHFGEARVGAATTATTTTATTTTMASSPSSSASSPIRPSAPPPMNGAPD